MTTEDLQRIINALIDARNAANWEGLFTSDVRAVTMEHRQKKIYLPLDEVICKLRKDMDRRTSKKKRNRKPKFRRAFTPYAD